MSDPKIKVSLKLKERYKGVFAKHALNIGAGLVGPT